jgi:protein TonB
MNRIEAVLLLLLSIPLSLGAQDTTYMTITKDTDTTVHVKDKGNKACNGKTFVKVDEMPKFPGGKEKMMQFIKDTLQYPEKAKENEVEGVVYVSFSICKDGSLNNVRVLKGIGNGCDKAAHKAVKAMPEWEPGKQNGEKVVVRKNVPIRFEL